MIRAIEQDGSRHSACKLRAALCLAAGTDVWVPDRAYPLSPGRFARALQMGNSAWGFLLSFGRKKTLVSGPEMAYIVGDLEYATERTWLRALYLLVKRQPFFVTVGNQPAASIASLAGCDPMPAPKLRLSSHCVVMIFANYKGTPAVMHVGTCEAGRDEVLRLKAGLDIAASDSRLRHLVSRILAVPDETNNVQVLAELRLPGNVPKFSWRRVDAVSQVWLGGKPMAAGPARPRLSQELTDLCESLPAYRDELCPLADALLQWHSVSRIPGGITHGDLWLGNVLFKGDAVSGIVDWEWAHRDGVRMLDLLHLLLMSTAVQRNLNIATALRELWADEISDPFLRERLTSVAVSFGADSDDLKFAALLLWFDYLRQRVIRGRMPTAAWTEDVIPRTVPAILNWLSRHKRETREIAA